MKPAGAWLSIIALFVSGVAIGAVGMQLFGGGAREELPERARWERERGHGDPRSPERMGQFLIERLQLDESQAEEVRDVLQDSAARAREMREAWRPQIEAHLVETRRQIEALLTEDQREQLAEMASGDARRMERMLLGGPPSRRRGMRGPGGPGGPGRPRGRPGRRPGAGPAGPSSDDPPVDPPPDAH